MKANLDIEVAEAQSAPGPRFTGRGCGRTVAVSRRVRRIPAGAYRVSRGTAQDLFQAGLDAVWELDLFGGPRRNLESANANVEAAVENIRDVQVSLVAEVALNYVQLRGYQQEIWSRKRT